LFKVSVVLIVLAFVTDVLDGYFARKLAVASINGRHWDSLGDKAVYAAIVIAFNAQGLLSPLLAWGLLVREIALYITRILYIEKLSHVERIRPFTNWHGYFMYLLIITGLGSMYGAINGILINFYPFLQTIAILALLCGVASIIHWLKIE